MISKRFLVIFLVGLYLFSGLPGIVSAGMAEDLTEGLSAFIRGIGEVLKVPLEAITGDNSSEEWFLAKSLLFVLIFIIVYVVVDNKMKLFKEHKWAVWIVSIAVSVLSIRWMGDSDVVQAILLPYNTLGIAISVLVPFFIYFFFTEDFNPTMRRVSRLLFGIVFIGVWYSRGDVIGLFSFAGWIYLGTALASLILFWADGTIEKYKKKIEHEKFTKVNEARIVANILKQRKDLEDQVVNGTLDPNGAHYRILDSNLEVREKKYGIK